MASPDDERLDLARRVWRLMFDYLMATSPSRAESLARRGLTPNDARALWSLREDEGRPIGTLANDWRCDPSNATFIVDRLERAALAERRQDPTDRRVKMVFLTSAGAKAKAELLDEYYRPPPELLHLPEQDLQALLTALEKLSRQPE